jgi:hypothetical protein
MKHIKKFNESFNSDDYLDYLLSEVDESKIQLKYEADDFLYLSYRIKTSDSKKVISYLEKSIRFKDVIVITQDGQDYPGYSTLDILIIDKTYYENNKKWVYKNIKWDKHPTLIELEGIGIGGGLIDDLVKSYSKAQIAVGLPEGFSIIRNLNRIGDVEFWPHEESEPIYLLESEEVYLQYILFKYLGN